MHAADDLNSRYKEVGGPVTSLDCLLDLPPSLIFDRRASAKGDEGHLIFVSHGDGGNVHKVVHL